MVTVGPVGVHGRVRRVHRRVDLVVTAGRERRMGDDGVGIAAVLDGAGVQRQGVRGDAQAVAVHIGGDHGVAEHEVGRAGATVVGGVAGVAADGEANARRAARRVDVHVVAEGRGDVDVIAGLVLVVGARAVQGEGRTGVVQGALRGGAVNTIVGWKSLNTKILPGVTSDGSRIGLISACEVDRGIRIERYRTTLRSRGRETGKHLKVVFIVPVVVGHAEGIRVGSSSRQRDGVGYRGIGVGGNEAGQRREYEDNR